MLLRIAKEIVSDLLEEGVPVSVAIEVAKRWVAEQLTNLNVA